MVKKSLVETYEDLIFEEQNEMLSESNQLAIVRKKKERERRKEREKKIKDEVRKSHKIDKEKEREQKIKDREKKKLNRVKNAKEKIKKGAKSFIKDAFKD